MLALAAIADGPIGLDPEWFPHYEYISMLTIEDGSIVPGADSYAARADVAAYAARYGATWGGAELAEEQAILRAMAFVEGVRFAGAPVSSAQPLSWPRAYAPAPNGGYYDSGAIPATLIRAVAEAAILELATPGALLAPALATTQIVRSRTDKVDTLERSVEYFEGAAPSKASRFERLFAWLAPLRDASASLSVRVS